MAGSEYFNGPWIPVAELREAVDAQLLTREEARTVLWAQLPELGRQAVRTPPPIGKAT